MLKYIYKNNFVYLIWNKITHKKYIGVKSSDLEPYDVIGKKYFSSSRDKDFINEQKEHPERFKYRVLKNFKSRKEAIELECFLHKKYDVAKSTDFYNLSLQVSEGFDVTGTKLKHQNPTKGRKRTDEEKKHISEGTKKAMKFQKSGEKISKKAKQKWKEHPELRKFYSELLTNTLRKMWANEDYREKMGKLTSERNKTREITEHMRQRSSESRKQEAKEGKGAYRKVKCPYCGKCTTLGNFSQHHGKNCKMKPLIPDVC